MDRVNSVSIVLPTAEAAKEFVRVVSGYPYEMDLRSGRYVVDAKSILGILSLDHEQGMRLDVYADDIADLLSDLAPFIAGE